MCNIESGSEGDVPVLLGRICLLLGGEHLKCADYAETRIARFDDVVYVAIFGCLIGVCKELGVFVLFLLLESCGIGCAFEVFGVEHAYSAFSTHDSDFCRRPSVVHVAAELLAAHHDVAAAIALAERNGYLRHGGFSVCIEELCAVEDDTVVLLAGSGKESRHVYERNERDIECVAEANEACTLA